MESSGHETAAAKAPAVSSRAIRQAVEDDIGGGVVLSPFRFGDRTVKAGDRLTEEEVRHMPRANRSALVSNRRLHVTSKSSSRDVANKTERQAFAIHRGGGKYDVIEGVKINDEPLSKEEAEALAGVEAKPN